MVGYFCERLNWQEVSFPLKKKKKYKNEGNNMFENNSCQRKQRFLCWQIIVAQYRKTPLSETSTFNKIFVGIRYPRGGQ